MYQYIKLFLHRFRFSVLFLWIATVIPSAAQTATVAPKEFPLVESEPIQIALYSDGSAVVTEELVSGTKGYKNARIPGEPFTVPADQVQSIKIGDRKTSTSKTIGLIIGIPVGLGVLLVAAYAVACHGSNGGC